MEQTVSDQQQLYQICPTADISGLESLRRSLQPPEFHVLLITASIPEGPNFSGLGDWLSRADRPDDEPPSRSLREPRRSNRPLS